MRIVIESDAGQSSATPVVSTLEQTSGALGSVVQVNAGAAPGAAGGGSDSATAQPGTVVNAGQAPVPSKQSPSSKKQ
jgi:hypothetical protein